MNLKKKFSILVILLIIGFIISPHVNSKNLEYKTINLQKISRYTEDRIVYQHIEIDIPKDLVSDKDTSISSLLIIKNKKMFLFVDGYDSLENARDKMQAYKNDMYQNKMLWPNNIDSKPDFVMITDRKVPIMQKFDLENKELEFWAQPESKKQKNQPDKKDKDFVAQNFLNIFKNVRLEFIKKHVEIFRDLLIKRGESEFSVIRARIPRKLYLGHVDEMPKYSTIASGRTIDSKIYYAIDANGDGITETFSVHIPDGFHWGVHSGPNIINIYNNKDKEIEKIIGNLTSEAHLGSKEEAKFVKDDMTKLFPKDNDPKAIREMIDRLVPTVKD